MIAILALLLAGCKAEPVELRCIYHYTFDTGVESGEYVAASTDCETYAGYFGWDTGICEQDGLDQGASDASCTCKTNTGRCTFPDGQVD